MIRAYRGIGERTEWSIEVKPPKSTVYTVKDAAGCVEERFEVRVEK